MAIIDFGKVGDALASARRMESKISISPPSTPPVDFASMQFSSLDFVPNSIRAAANRESTFVWTVHSWGSKDFKVDE